MPGSKFRVVAEAKDLNPRKVRLLRYNVPPLDRVNSGVDPAAECYLPFALRASDTRAVPIDCNRHSRGVGVPERAGLEDHDLANCQTPAVGCSLSTASSAGSVTRCLPRTEEKVQTLLSRKDTGVTIAIVISCAQ
jgi:hypothetical protein